MILFPAIDIKGGKAVRLLQGRKDQCTVFADNPVEMARHWRDQGAQWLHIVDLDGAFEGHCANSGIIGEIVQKIGLPVQVGGGIRSLEAAKSYLDAGATRLIIGTMALEQPQDFANLCGQFPGKIGVSLDAENGRLKSRGWVADAGLTLKEILPQLSAAGAAFLVYTDILRDGTKQGVNLDALKDLLQQTTLPVLAAGGVSNLEDIRNLCSLPYRNLAGIITGRAIYEGTLSLSEALAIL